MAQQLSKKKLIVFHLIMWSLLTVGAVKFGKFAYKRWNSFKNMTSRTINIEPDVRFYVPHPVLGYTSQPGEFLFTEKVRDVEGQLRYSVSIGEDHSRNSGYYLSSEVSRFGNQSSFLAQDRRPQIWIFGCSFGWGQGIDDEDTFAYKIQQQFPKYLVRNFSQNGYGTTQMLLFFKELLANHKKMPAAIVISHIPWHSQRNVGDPKYLEALYWYSAFRQNKVANPWESFKYQLKHKAQKEAQTTEDTAAFNYPRAFFDKEQKLMIEPVQLQANYTHHVEKDQHRVTEVVLKEIAMLAQKNDISPILLRLWHNKEKGDPLEDSYEEMGFYFQDAYVDYSLPKFNKLPWNGHPNELANDVYAEELAHAIKNAIVE